MAFIDHDNDGMSTLIESQNIADAMRQVFQFAKKHVEASSDQDELFNVANKPPCSKSHTKRANTPTSPVSR